MAFLGFGFFQNPKVRIKVRITGWFSGEIVPDFR